MGQGQKDVFLPPLHIQRVDFDKSEVSGNHEGIIRGKAAAPACGYPRALEGGEPLEFPIGEPDPVNCTVNLRAVKVNVFAIVGPRRIIDGGRIQTAPFCSHQIEDAQAPGSDCQGGDIAPIRRLREHITFQWREGELNGSAPSGLARHNACCGRLRYATD